MPLLEQLAETLVPLTEWIASKPYVPPDPDLPWRKPGGANLTPKDLGIVAFLQQLIDDEFDQHLVDGSYTYVDWLKRLKEVEADPLGKSPIADIGQWRAARGLSSGAQFGIVKSNNVLVADGQPLLRAEFYRKYLDILRSVYANASADPEFSWRTFVDALAGDTCAFWPAAAPKSSSFIWQFAEDILYAMLGMKNDAADPAVRFALLIELGERRRVGNRYGPHDAEEAVRKFEETCARLARAPAPERETYTAIHPPVGAPPITTKSA